MRHNGTLPALVLLSILAACSSAGIDPIMQKKADQIQIIQRERQSELLTRKYQTVKEIIGVSCSRQIGSRPSILAAREMLRLEAARLDADAVILGSCEEKGAGLMLDCWKALECRAEAIKWTTDQRHR